MTIFKESIDHIVIFNKKNRYYQYVKKNLHFINKIYIELKLTKQINIIVEDGSKMKRLALKHLKENKAATVLTFNFDEWSDIYISVYNIIKKNSIVKKSDLDREIKDYFIHCLLNVKDLKKTLKEELYWTLLDKYKVI